MFLVSPSIREIKFDSLILARNIKPLALNKDFFKTDSGGSEDEDPVGGRGSQSKKKPTPPTWKGKTTVPPPQKKVAPPQPKKKVTPPKPKKKLAQPKKSPIEPEPPRLTDLEQQQKNIRELEMLHARKKPTANDPGKLELYCDAWSITPGGYTKISDQKRGLYSRGGLYTGGVIVETFSKLNFLKDSLH